MENYLKKLKDTIYTCTGIPIDRLAPRDNDKFMTAKSAVMHNGRNEEIKYNQQRKEALEKAIIRAYSMTKF